MNDVVLAKLMKLAKRKSFNPDDYRRRELPRLAQCRVCAAKFAPAGICGICRGRVKMIRAGKPI